MAWKHISVELGGETGRVLFVRLSRPDRRNAMSVAMVESLQALLASPDALAAGAIVISGEGRGFCAGSDLSDLAGMSAQQRSRFEEDCGCLARTMTTHPRPILAAVHGFAIGGGLTLAAACDIVISTAAAKWSLPEVPIGLFPAWGLEPVTIRVGRAFAKRLAFGIDTFSGTEALAAGLADLLAEDPLHATAMLADRLAALPATQAAAVKDYFAAEKTGAEADRHANRLFTIACETNEARASFERFGR